MAEISLLDIDTHLATELVLGQDGIFTTYAVARHPRMLERHGPMAQAAAYNGTVGKVLKRLCDAHGRPLLEDMGKRKVGTSTTNQWRVVGQARVSTPAPVQAVARHEVVPQLQVRREPLQAAQEALGPQCASDPAFTARMRLHQSWYRAHVLGLPCGTGPSQSDTAQYGNYLTRADGARGANFLTPAIFSVAQARLAEQRGVIEPYRLLHNLLSSQPMCFNLFGPLVRDLDLATRLMSALLPGEVERVEQVAIEYGPEPAQDYLGDRTAFDAFVAWVRPDGRRAFLGIETKLTEPFSQQDYDSPLYRRWMDAEAPWRLDASGQVQHIRHNQLWRDHLLATALQRKQRDRWAQGRLAVVHHPLDLGCVRTVQAYQALLRDGDDSFRCWTVEHIVAAWERVVASDAEQAWLAQFRVRYLTLAASGTRPE